MEKKYLSSRESPDDYLISIHSRKPLDRKLREQVLALEETLERYNRPTMSEIVESFVKVLESGHT